MGLGLVEAAHNAEGNALVGVGEEAGDDGVQWALVWGDAVGMVGVDVEEAAAVVEVEAEIVGGDAGAEFVEDGLDPGDHVSVFVDDGEVDGVFKFGGFGGGEVAAGAGGVDELGALGGEGFGE